jgi:hypothetical protein
VARDPDDVRAQKHARTEFARRGIDTTKADIRAMHGIVHVRGTLQRMASASIPDLKAETELIARTLRQKAEIRDVVLEVQYRA